MDNVKVLAALHLASLFMALFLIYVIIKESTTKRWYARQPELTLLLITLIFFAASAYGLHVHTHNVAP